MAPIGVAAFNIGGLTIHRALNLPVEHENSTTYRKLGAERLKELRQSWKYVNTIIIYEFKYGLIQNNVLHSQDTN